MVNSNMVNTGGAVGRWVRPDYLGRHFRSDAGYLCIRPLLEENAEKNGGREGTTHTFSAEPANASNNSAIFKTYNPNSAASTDMNPPESFLPEALLQQYPALAGIQWDQLPVGEADEPEFEDDPSV